MIEVTWHNEDKTIVQWSFLASWTWEDFLAAVMTSKALVAEVSHPVDLVFLAMGTHFPTGNAIQHIVRTVNNRSANVRYVVIVGTVSFENALLRTLVGAFAAWNPHIKFVSTLEEAYQLIDGAPPKAG